MHVLNQSETVVSAFLSIASGRVSRSADKMISSPKLGSQLTLTFVVFFLPELCFAGGSFLSHTLFAPDNLLHSEVLQSGCGRWRLKPWAGSVHSSALSNYVSGAAKKS